MQGCRAFGNLHNNRAESDFRTNTETILLLGHNLGTETHGSEQDGGYDDDDGLWRSREIAGGVVEQQRIAEKLKLVLQEYVGRESHSIIVVCVDCSSKCISANVCALYCNILNTFIRYDDANGFLKRICTLRHAVLLKHAKC